MLFFRLLWVLSIFLCIFLSNSQAASTHKDKAFRSFWHPEYHGERLDYCCKNSGKCGLPVAHQYCKLMGFDYASQEIKAPNVGLTRYFGSSQKCKGWQCNGFMTIACAQYIKHKPPKSYHYRLKRFVFPRMNDYRIDWCYKPKQKCGARAAHSFCMRMGYAGARSFRRDPQVQATKTVGDQALCFGKLCSGFSHIICYR